MMTNSELKTQTFKVDAVEKSSFVLSPKTSVVLKIAEYLSISTFICVCLLIIVLPDNQLLFILGAVALSLLIFFFLLDRQLLQNFNKGVNPADIKEKAQLYTCLLDANNSLENRSLSQAREKALQYCQELINDYKNTRNNSRNIYYIFQISTVVLSGVTPILVLVDKLEAGQSWLKWLPVICPAIASIVASIVTSFPFQENWISANTAVESLEAEQEKFILGVTPAYRCYDLTDDTQRQQMAKAAIENFINQVNTIHLNQVQQGVETQVKKEEKTEQS